MDQRQYTLSNKDKKFISAIVFLQASFIVLAISAFGFYYKSEINDCRRIVERLHLSDWATDEVDKAQSEQKIEDIKESYKNQGVVAEEF